MTKRGVNLSVISEEILPLCRAAEYPHALEPSTAKQIAQALHAILRHVWFSTWWEAWVRNCISVGVLAETNSANALPHEQLWILIKIEHTKESIRHSSYKRKPNNTSKHWLDSRHPRKIIRKSQAFWKAQLILLTALSSRELVFDPQIPCSMRNEPTSSWCCSICPFRKFPYTVHVSGSQAH